MNRFKAGIIFFSLVIVLTLQCSSTVASSEWHTHTGPPHSPMDFSVMACGCGLASFYPSGLSVTPGWDWFSADRRTLNRIRSAMMQDGLKPEPGHYDELSPRFSVSPEDENQLSTVDVPQFTFKYTAPEPDCYGGGLGITFKNGISLDFAFSYLTDIEYMEKDSTGMAMTLRDWGKSIYNPFSGLELLLQRDIMIGTFKVSFPLGGL